MSKILFHPDIPVVEAARIAQSQGGRLVWKELKPRYRRAMLHNRRAMLHNRRAMLHNRRAMLHNRRALACIEAQDYEGALGHIAAARAEVEGVAPCAA